MSDFLEIVEIKTDEVVRRIDVSAQSERGVERTLSGLLRQMDTEHFFVREVGGDHAN